MTPLTAASFARPPAADQPWARMNIPATADPAEIRAELRDLHEKGIAGVEIGQGAFPNDGQLAALLSEANRLGIKISLSHGPTQYPTAYSIDDDHARKTLVFAKSPVFAGGQYFGPLPPPPPPAPGRGGAAAVPRRATLVAVLAYRCTAIPCPASGVVELDRSSVRDLTLLVSGTSTASVLGGTIAGYLRW